MERCKRSSPTQRLTAVAALLLALAIVSCSGAGNPDKAIHKMVHAYGGSKNVARLQSFIARGFIKDYSQKIVVESFALDMYRKGPLYKHVITKAPRGTITNVIVMYYDGKRNFQWISGSGLKEVAPMEVGVLRYRFPTVLQWVQYPGRTGELLPAEKKQGTVRLRYKDGDYQVTVLIDKKTWLLSGVDVKGLSDTSFVYSEMYEHYFDLGGIPFPATFRATYKGSPYYEFLVPTVELQPDLPDTLFRVTAEDTAAFAKPKEVKPQGAK